MGTSKETWFVEEFHLRSPVDEFREFGRLEVERLRKTDAKFDEARYRAAIELVLGRLQPAGPRNSPTALSKGWSEEGAG